MYRYFITTPAVGHYLVDKYNDTVNPHREAIIGPFLEEAGALGVVLQRGFGTPAVVQAFVFPADHEITQMEGAHTQPHESGVVVTFEGGTKMADVYSSTLNWINQKLSGFPEFSDWLHTELNVARFALSPDRKPLMTASQLLPDGRIAFCVPEGMEGQAPLEPDRRLTELTEKLFQEAVTTQ